MHGLTVSQTAGIFNEGRLTLDHVKLLGNSTDIVGVFAVENTGDLTVSNSLVSATGGIGIASTAGSVSIIGSTFVGNESRPSGSALHADSTEVHIVNSTFSDNDIFGNRGIGAVYLKDGVATLTNVTITGNHRSGVVLSGTQTALVNNSIIAGNTDSQSMPNDIRLFESSTIDTASRHNLIGDSATAGGLTDSVNGNIVGNAGTGVLDIDDVLDVTLRDLGGATMVHPLVVDSRAIDGGDNTVAVDADGNPLISDQRKFPFRRIFDGNGDDTLTVDIGAFEVQEATPLPSPNAIIVTKMGDENDGNITPGELTLREAFELANKYLDPNEILFGVDVRDTIVLGGTELEARSDININGPGSRSTDFSDLSTEEADALTSTSLAISDNGTSRVLNVQPEAHVQISDLTISNGWHNLSGGGILNSGTTALKRVVLADHIVQQGSEPVITVNGGGAIRNNRHGTLLLEDVHVVDNSADGFRAYGGGILNDGYLHAVNVQIERNTADWGAGLAMENRLGELDPFRPRAFFTRAIVADNSASASGLGGGILSRHADLRLHTSTVARNDAGSGGGLFAQKGAVDIIYSTFESNEALGAVGIGGDGGAASITGGTEDVLIYGSTFNDNTARAAGGGLWLFPFGSDDPETIPHGQFTLANSTISGNSGIGVHLPSNNAREAGSVNIRDNTIVANTGGGLNVLGATVNELRNNIFSNNSGSSHSDVTVSTGSTFLNPPQHNLVQNYDSADWEVDSGVTSPNNHNQLNVDPKLKPLDQPDGSQTFVHGLQIDSTAVDTGSSDRVLDQARQPVFDVETKPNAGAPFASIDDIGSFEAQFSTIFREWTTLTSDGQFSSGDEPASSGVGYSIPNSSIPEEPGFLGLEVDPKPFTFGGVKEGLFGDQYGAELEADIRFKAGLEYGHYANAGSVDVYYSGLSTFTIDDPRDGTQISIDTQTELLDGSLYTVSPNFGAYVDLVIELEITIGGQACVIGCVEGEIPPIGINLHQNIFSINRQMEDDDGNPLYRDANGVTTADRSLAVGPALDGEIQFVGAKAIEKLLEKVEKNVAKKLNETKTARSKAENQKKEADKQLSKNGNQTQRTQLKAASAEAQRQVDEHKKAEKSLTRKKKAVGALQTLCVGPSPGVQVCFGEADGDLLGLEAKVQAGADVGKASIGKELGSLAVTVPDVQLVDQSIDASGRLSATTDDFAPGSVAEQHRQIANMTLDIAGILGPMVGIPAGKYTIDLGPLAVEAQLLSYNIETILGLTQSVDVTPFQQLTKLEFDKAVTVNGTSVAANGIYDYTPGVRLDIIPVNSEQPVEVTPRLDIVSKFHNDVGLDVNVTGIFEALSLSLEAFGKTFIDVGPLIRDVHSIGSFDIGSVFNRTFNLKPGVTVDPLAPFADGQIARKEIRPFMIGKGADTENVPLQNGRTPATAIRVIPGQTFDIPESGTFYLSVPTTDTAGARYDTINFDLLSVTGSAGISYVVVSEYGLTLQDTASSGAILTQSSLVPDVVNPAGTNPNLGSNFRITGIHDAEIEGRFIVGVRTQNRIPSGLVTQRDKIELPTVGTTEGSEITSASLKLANKAVTASLIDSDGGLDVDGDGIVDPLTDGQLFMRYMNPNNLRGADLIAGVIGPNATRTTAADIESHLVGVLTADRFGVEQSSEIFAYSHGMYLVQHMSGLTGSLSTEESRRLDGAFTTSSLDLSRIANSGFVSRSTGDDVFGIDRRNAIAEDAIPGSSPHNPLQLEVSGANHTVTLVNYGRSIAFNEAYVLDRNDSTQRTLVASGAVGTPQRPTGVGPDDPTSQASVNEFSQRLQMQTVTAMLGTDEPMFVDLPLADSWEFTVPAGIKLTALVFDNGAGDNGLFDHQLTADGTEVDFEVFLPDTNERFDVTMNSLDQPILVGGSDGVSRVQLIRKELPLQARRGLLEGELPDINLSLGLILTGASVSPTIGVTMVNPSAETPLPPAPEFSQVVALSAGQGTVQFGDTVNVTAAYNVTGHPAASPGMLSLRVHYDSSKWTFDAATSALAGFDIPRDVTETVPDGDMHTDRVVELFWLDTSGNGFMNVNAVDAALMSFTAQDTTAQTSFNVTRADSAVSGFDSTSASVDIVPTTFLVDNTATDTNDGNFAVGQLTLREALDLANSANMASVIEFASTVSTVGLESELPAIANTVTIVGPGAGLLTVTAGANSRILSVAGAGIVELSGVTLTGGNVTGSGGAILNTGTLALDAVRLVGNTASQDGGAIAGPGALSISNSELSSNHAAGDAGAVLAEGATVIVNSTISGNSADGNAGAASVIPGASLTIRNSTVVANESSADGLNSGTAGGLLQTGTGRLLLYNTIVAGNRDLLAAQTEDIIGVIDALSSGNLISDPDTSGNVDPTTNIVGDGAGGELPLSSIVNPELMVSGATGIHQLAAFSAALDAGNNAEARNAEGTLFLDADQVGNARIFGTTIDIGAVEFLQAADPIPANALADIDGSGGAPDQFTDGVLMLAYLSGLRAAAQIQPLLSSGATVADAQVVVDRLGGLTNGENSSFNVDQSGGAVDQFTDGVLLLAYFSGLRQAAQIAPLIITPPATINAAQIVEALDALFAVPGAAPAAGHSTVVSAAVTAAVLSAAATTDDEVELNVETLQSANAPSVMASDSDEAAARSIRTEVWPLQYSGLQTPQAIQSDSYFASLTDDALQTDDQLRDAAMIGREALADSSFTPSTTQTATWRAWVQAIGASGQAGLQADFVVAVSDAEDGDQLNLNLLPSSDRLLAEGLVGSSDQPVNSTQTSVADQTKQNPDGTVGGDTTILEVPGKTTELDEHFEFAQQWLSTV